MGAVTGPGAGAAIPWTARGGGTRDGFPGAAGGSGVDPQTGARGGDAVHEGERARAVRPQRRRRPCRHPAAARAERGSRRSCRGRASAPWRCRCAARRRGATRSSPRSPSTSPIAASALVAGVLHDHAGTGSPGRSTSAISRTAVDMMLRRVKKPAVVVFESVHTAIGAWQGRGDRLDLVDLLVAVVTHPRLRMVVTTTPDGWAQLARAQARLRGAVHGGGDACAERGRVTDDRRAGSGAPRRRRARDRTGCRRGLRPRRPPLPGGALSRTGAQLAARRARRAGRRRSRRHPRGLRRAARPEEVLGRQGRGSGFGGRSSPVWRRRCWGSATPVRPSSTT